jgi:hypothetical protein
MKSNYFRKISPGIILPLYKNMKSWKKILSFIDKLKQLMKKAIIIYNSKTGTTKKLGEGIFDYLLVNGVHPNLISIDDFNYDNSLEYDLFFLGCWTSGLLFFLQRPEKIWIDFAQKLPYLSSDKTILFTTYKIRTGSMFREMRKYLRF